MNLRGGTTSSVAIGGSGVAASFNNSTVGVEGGAPLDNAITALNDATWNDQGGVSLNNSSATLSNQAVGNKVVGSPSSAEIEVEKAVDVETGFDMAACKNHGPPISVEWDSKSRFFIDGFGLRSPTRWQPWDRGVNRSSEAKDLLASIYSLLLREVVSSIGDPSRVCYELVLGRLKSPPFPLKAVERCRTAIGALLGVADAVLEVPQVKPLHLHLVACVLKVVGDPDTGILMDGNDTCATGESKSRCLGHLWCSRLRSATGSLTSQSSTLFRKIILQHNFLKKSLRPSSEKRSLWEECFHPSCLFCSRNNDRLRVMAAITKPDGGRRPLHDGTHSVRANNDIIYMDRIQCPCHPPRWLQWFVNVLSRRRLLLQWQQTSSSLRTGW